jgi:hypothetical protein
MIDQQPNETEQPEDVRKVIGLVRQSHPNVCWTRLKVTHPTDNDRLWYFWLPDQSGDVQIEFDSISDSCPFLVETDKHDQRFVGQTVQEVAGKIIEWLALSGGTFEPVWFHR